MMENIAISWYLPGDLVWDILVHVPTKSLMRFKLVSKLWYSIIRNLDFAKSHSLYQGCFRGLIITDFGSDYPNLYQSSAPNRIFYADLNANNVDDCTTLEYYEHVTWDVRDFNHATSIVKGLIGLYNGDGFTLCNISTQEMVKLPRSYKSKFNNYHDCYHLGFDPVEDVYKVLKLSSDYSTSSFYTQIFTVGRDSDLTWRNIDNAPDDCDTPSLCIDGTLYWLLSDINDYALVAFHLNSESFETIPLPEALWYFPNLAEIDGSPAIICLDGVDDSYDIDIWMMEKDPRGRFESWMMKKYFLPLHKLVYGGTLPTGEMLITQSVLEEHPMLIFKYDHIKNEMKLTKLYGPSGSQKHGIANLASLQICYHEENILPLAPLLIKQPELTVMG